MARKKHHGVRKTKNVKSVKKSKKTVKKLVRKSVKKLAKEKSKKNHYKIREDLAEVLPDLEEIILDESVKKSVKELESEILQNPELTEEEPSEYKEVIAKPSRDMLEQIMFKLPYVIEPLIGTPKQVQKILDALVKKMQKHPGDDVIFDKIHLYIHGYLINVVLKKFPFIRGLQTVDVYQETLIALRFKAIPNFKNNRGMSFLNFAKMCIRRHLITLLNASKNRKKDQSINQAVSIDSSPIRNDDENRGTYANIIPDKKDPCDKLIECSEAYNVTKNTLFDTLSDFERMILNEYLSSSSYKEISKSISVSLNNRYNTKSIDNALIRIRKKASHLMKFGKKEDLPIFMPKS